MMAAMSAPRGIFVTFEGLDGSGKTTQLARLAETLRGRGVDVLTTREPGAGPIGERIRAILLDSRTAGLSPLAELALMFADRAQHIEEVILPAIEKGLIVLCDRYTDSTEAYQGAGRQLGSDIVLELHRLLCRDLWPDLTLLLDADKEASVGRAQRRNQRSSSTEGRFESEDAEFFARVADGFSRIAEREPRRVARIPSGSISEVRDAVLRAFDARFLELASAAAAERTGA
jgi:dTMP kinase